MGVVSKIYCCDLYFLSVNWYKIMYCYLIDRISIAVEAEEVAVDLVVVAAIEEVSFLDRDKFPSYVLRISKALFHRVPRVKQLVTPIPLMMTKVCK